jgi:hypothetical protein
MKKQCKTKLQRLCAAFADLFKAKECNVANDKLEILKKVILNDTTTFDKIWLFESLKAVFEADLKDVESNANRDLVAINSYNKIANPETYAKSLYVTDPIFERKTSDIVDYELLNQL